MNIVSGFLYVKGRWKKDKTLIVIVNVYSPCDVRLKRQLWDEITGVRQQEPCRRWCVIGDFNAVRTLEERSGQNQDGRGRKEIKGFNEVINNTANGYPHGR